MYDTIGAATIGPIRDKQVRTAAPVMAGIPGVKTTPHIAPARRRIPKKIGMTIPTFSVDDAWKPNPASAYGVFHALPSSSRTSPISEVSGGITGMSIWKSFCPKYRVYPSPAPLGFVNCILNPRVSSAFISLIL